MVTAKKPKRTIDPDVFAALERRAELADARCQRALDAAAALLRIVEKIGGYLTPEQQHVLWNARAALAEAGRKSGGEQ